MIPDSSGPTSRIYFSQRLRLHYVDWGNPGAPPLLLVHGGRDHCRNWDWLAAALRDDWHIVFEASVPQEDVPNYVEAVDRWIREAYQVCPAPVICTFRLTLLPFAP